MKKNEITLNFKDKDCECTMTISYRLGNKAEQHLLEELLKTAKKFLES